MKVNLYQMRDRGVSYPKGRVGDHGPIRGELLINTTQDNHLNRISKVAKLQRGPQDDYYQLFDVSIVWMTEDRLMLTGFEQYKAHDRPVTDYAQSWLCLFGWDNKLPTSRDDYERRIAIESAGRKGKGRI